MSSPSSSPRDVQRTLDSAAVRTDRLLAHISRILATTSGTYTLLQTLQYFLHVFHTQLSRVRDWKLRQFMLAVARKASTNLLPGETVVATVKSPTKRLDNVIAGSKALAGMISDFRTFMRLWGLLDVYNWGKSTWHNPPQDQLVKAVVWSQVLAGVGYQWYENVAYLASKGVLRGERFNERKQALWYEWSSRFWMAHIALEVVRLTRTWQLKAAEVDADSAEKKAATVETSTAWKREAIVNAAWAPVSAHYSWEQGCISEHSLAFFGAVASGLGFRQLWKQTS